VMFTQPTLAVVLMSPWIVMMLGASWSTATSDAIRGRALAVAVHRRNQARATPVVVLALTLSVVTTATLVFDVAASQGSTDGLSMVFFGIFLTLIVLGALVYASRELLHESDLIRVEIADLAPAYRRNVDNALVDATIDTHSPLVWLAFVPTFVAVVSVVVSANW
jgi:hypothetical protein